MVRALVVLVLAAAVLASPAAAAPPVQTEILQYAKKPQTDAGQRDGRRLVAGLRRLGLEVRGFEVLPMVTVTGTKARLRRAHRLPQVLHHHVLRDRLNLHLDKSVPLIFRGPAAPVRAAAGDARGERVAILDTGVNGLHPDLTGRVVRNVEFVLDPGNLGNGGRPNDLGIPVGAVAMECSLPCNTDQHGHGTHVAGIVAGEGTVNGTHVGVAPGAELVGLSVTQTGHAQEFYAMAGFDYLLAHPELGVTAVNNSWSATTDRWETSDPINQATKMLADAGITPVFSAGNDGEGEAAAGQPKGSSDCQSGMWWKCSISMHGAAPWTISVAAGDQVHGAGLENQDLAPYSSRGDPRAQTVGGVRLDFTPTLTAPGTGIIATGLAGALGADPRQVLYESKSGTSMAAPHVAGTIALLQSAARAKLGRRLTPAEVKRALVDGATPMTAPAGVVAECTLEREVTAGCSKGGTCSVVGACRPTPRKGEPYPSWEAGAGYLDVRGALREIDEMASPAAPVVPAAAPPTAPAPPAANAPAPAAVSKAPAARAPATKAETRKATKRKAGKRKGKKRTRKARRAKRR